MARSTRFSCVLLALIAACAPPGPTPVELESRSEEASAAPSAVSDEAPTGKAASDGSDERRAVELDVPDSAPTTELGCTEDGAVHIRVRFLEAEGTPCSSVEIADALGLGRALSSEDGLATVEFRPHKLFARGVLFLRARKPGRALRCLSVSYRRGQILDLGDVVLQPESRVQGHVQGEDGKSIGASVGICGVDSVRRDTGLLRRLGPSEQLLMGGSEAECGFDIGEIPAGTWRLWATTWSDTEGYAVSDPFEIGAAQQLGDFVLVVPRLQAEDTIEGQVLDATGIPVSAASVCLLGPSTALADLCATSCNSEGKFVLKVGSQVSGRLVAGSYAQRDLAVLEDVKPGARGVLLRPVADEDLPRARIRLIAPAGKSIRQVSFTARNCYGFPTLYESSVCEEVAPGEFAFRLPAIPFDARFRAIVQDEWGDKICRPIEWKAVDPRVARRDRAVQLDLQPRIRGNVMAGGSPVPDVSVESRDVFAGEQRMSVQGFPCSMRPPNGFNRPNRTSYFRVMPGEERFIYLHCSAPGYAPTILGPLDQDVEHGELLIELGPGGTLEGRTLATDGTPVADVLVGITCGDGAPQTARSRADGTYRFEGLAAAKWLVVEAKEEVRPDVKAEWTYDTRPIVWSCEVAVGRVTTHNLRLDR
ncbi:MAG: carboxypeptidase-like regulatory domain-containing protein [Planctomycetota bacterium]